MSTKRLSPAAMNASQEPLFEDPRVATITKQYDSLVAIPVYRPFILVSFLLNGTYSKTLNNLWEES